MMMMMWQESRHHLELDIRGLHVDCY